MKTNIIVLLLLIFPSVCYGSTSRIDSEIRSQGIPIHGVSGSQGSIRIDFKPEATAQQRTNAQTIVDNFDWSPAAADASARTALLTASKGYLTDDTPDAKAMRNAFRVVMSSLIETRAKVNEVITKGNIPNTTALPNRTWAQVVGATKNQIDTESDPNA